MNSRGVCDLVSNLYEVMEYIYKVGVGNAAHHI